MTFMPNVIEFFPREMTTGLRRPRILVNAARAGQNRWRRARDLPRLLRAETCPAPGTCLPRLRAEEARLNASRLQKQADYDLHRHVLLMIAILAEMRETTYLTLPVDADGSVHRKGASKGQHSQPKAALFASEQ